MRRSLVSAIAVLVLLAPSADAAKPPGYWENCQSKPLEGAGWFNARAHGVSCRAARHVANRWTYHGDHSPARWRCNYNSTGYESGKVKCRRNAGEAVLFSVGA